MIYYYPRDVFEKGRKVEPLFSGKKPPIEEGKISTELRESRNNNYFSLDLTNYKDNRSKN